MMADELAKRMKAHGRSVLEGELHERLEALMFAIKTVLPPRNKSETTGYARLSIWIDKAVRSGRMNPDEAFPDMVRLVLKASGPYSKEPRAVFASMVRKHYGYPR